jgi:osmotically-inducible protein OsmY
MKNDSDLQADVLKPLKWEPILNTAEIEVTTKDGLVSLTGNVDSYAKKLEAEKVAKRVIGVKVLVENIEVDFPKSWMRTDAEITSEILIGLKSNCTIPEDKITVIVDDGWVTLEGELPWDYQRVAAKNVVNFLKSIKGVTNNIKIKSDSQIMMDHTAIKNAIARSLSVNDNEIEVIVSGTTVTIRGTVNSWYQKEGIEHITWKTPGICNLKNELVVNYFFVLII